MHCTALHYTSLHCTTVYLSSGLLCEEPGAVVPGEYCGRPGGGGGTQEGDLQCAVYRYSVQTSVQCRLQGKVYRVQSTECTLQMTYYKVHTVGYRIHIADCRPTTSPASAASSAPAMATPLGLKGEQGSSLNNALWIYGKGI